MTPISPHRILVVDDNVAVAEGLAVLLQMERYTVEIAHDGLTALNAIEVFKPQIVLLDIGLPDIDGYEIARRIRAAPETKSVYLIALTGYGQEEDKACSRAAGFDRHLVKPVDVGELLTVVMEYHTAATPVNYTP